MGLVTASAAAIVQASPGLTAPTSPEAIKAQVSKAAAAYVAGRPSILHASADEAFVQHPVVSSGGMQYVAYDRTYKGLPVRGGDFVVVTDAAGTTKYTSVAQTKAIGSLSITPSISKATAEKAARTTLKTVSNVEGTQLVVNSLAATPALNWETTLSGTGAEGYSRLTVDVDAATGKIVSTQEHVTDVTGSGTGAWEGNVSLNTTQSGSTFTMRDPSTTNLSCQNASGNTVFSGSDNVWGDGNGTNRETGCVDAFYTAQTEVKMLSQWLGRNAMDGNGGAWPIRVGLNDENAFYDGTQVQVGHNTANQWIGSLDVVGHEMGHGVDDHTPGGISRSGTQEFVADTFGASTEWFANNPADPPDFLVGEEVNLVGSGPIRNMANPSTVGDPNCYSSSIPGAEVHAAAGPGDHWFYLLSQGTNGSPTCNSTTFSGVGIQNAMKIMYNAMLMKTSSSSYLRYRVWTLQAAKNLDATCGLFNATKNAWNAVSVPAQSGEATCTSGTPSPTPTTSPTGNPGGCSGQKLANPGFESGAASWTATAGVIGQYGSQGQPTHSGTWNAWLDGYGRTHTDTLSQSVAIPSGCRATLSFFLHIDTSETTTSTQFDKLTVQVGSTTVGTFSNLNRAAGYTQRSFDVSSFAGQTVTVKFTGTEDSSLQTSFVIDDTALTLS